MRANSSRGTSHGLHWSAGPKPLLKQTEDNTPEHYSVQIYNMGVFRYEGLYMGLPSIYHHTGNVPPDWPGFEKRRLSHAMQDAVSKFGDNTGFYNIQLVTSRDLVHWQRVAERQPFLEASPLGAGAYDKCLEMKFSTSAAGSIQVELQDASGKPIPGFALEDCPEIYGDRLSQVVEWKQGSDVSKLAGKPIRLRFVMKDADLYAIQFP